MKRFLLLISVYTVCCFITGCSRSQDIEDTDLLFETSEFSCYSIESATKSDELFTERIVVCDSPDLDIVMGRYQQTKGFGGYEHIALITPENGEPFTMLCKQTITDDGILLNYLIDGTETMEFLVPSVGDVKTKGMGEDTMKCIEDVYSNHGRVSVWVTVQTAFIPETAVAFAAVCAANQIYTKRKSTKALC